MLLRLVTTAALVGHALAWYLPGAQPTDYKPKDPVELDVNKLTPELDEAAKVVSVLPATS